MTFNTSPIDTTRKALEAYWKAHIELTLIILKYEDIEKLLQLRESRKCSQYWKIEHTWIYEIDEFNFTLICGMTATIEFDFDKVYIWSKWRQS